MFKSKGLSINYSVGWKWDNNWWINWYVLYKVLLKLWNNNFRCEWRLRGREWGWAGGRVRGGGTGARQPRQEVQLQAGHVHRRLQWHGHILVLLGQLFYCQPQGPTLGPTQGRVKVKVRTWSGHGQVRSNSNSNSNSKVGPELNTKIGFHHHSPTTTISKSVFRGLPDYFLTVLVSLV